MAATACEGVLPSAPEQAAGQEPPQEAGRDAELARGAARAPTGGRFAIFSPLAVLACTMLLVLEFFVNARGVDFDGPPTPECHFRMKLKRLQACAAAMDVNPLFGPGAPALARLGALSGAKIADHWQVWRLLSGPFLPGGLVQWAGNVFLLVNLGRSMEHLHGWWRVGAIYLLAGMSGGLACAMFAPRMLSAGLSGSICGLLGAAAGDVWLNWEVLPSPCCRLVNLLLAGAVQAVLGLAPLVDYYSLAVGFATGVMSAIFIMDRLTPRTNCCAVCSRRVSKGVAGVLVLAAFIGGLALVFNVGGVDAQELCPQCEVLACAPFPWGCSDAKCWWTCAAAELPRSD
uniref:Rhomboid-like protease n=1 Tax=Zooxanthella nutricula TaxID=1333877 RepID=A0A6U6I0U6_9DINO